MQAKNFSRQGLAIYFLGHPELRRDNQLLPPLATQKTQSLLAYLILHCNQPHLREELAALFWGDRDDVHARHSLTTALWSIRRLLGKDYLLADSTTVQFNPASQFWLDVNEFDQLVHKYAAKPADLATAVELYRGDFLEGFYDDWCIEERYYLESLYLDALRRLVDWHEAQGDIREVLAYAQKYLARDPLMQEVHLAAMRALVASGDLAGARRQWQICCEARQHELHAPPSPDMLKQAESLLGAQFAIPLPVEPLPLEAPLRWDNFERPPFVGRRREMDALLARWEKATRGQGGMVFISGEAGVGKTRLTEEFASVVRWRGGVVARGRCYEPERALPLQLLAEVLRDLSRQQVSIPLERSTWAQGELARLVPELVTSSFNPVPSLSSLQPDQQAILFHAIATIIHQFSSQSTLLIVLEDLHWAAGSTLAAVHYLARQTANLRVFYLATFRPEDVNHPHTLFTMTAQLTRDGLAQYLALGRLAVDAIAELVRHTFTGDADFVNRLYEHTQGNAFFTIETLRALSGAPLPEGPLPVPDTVRALIKSRLEQLSASAREWIALAAVAGRSFDFDLVCRARGVDEDTALEAIDELLHLGFLREGSGSAGSDYEFVHHLVHETTYTGIHHRRRRRQHRLIGEAMESLYPDRSSVSSALAHHFEASGEVEKATHYHELAAQKAMAVFAWQEAEEHLGRALLLLDQLDPEFRQVECLRRRGQILINRAELRYLRARLAGLDADLEALGALAESSGDDYLHLQTRIQRARYLNLDAQYKQAIAAAQEGLVFAERLQEKVAYCFLLTQIGFAHYFLGQPQPALTALESALDIVTETDSETRRHITHILGYVHYHLGNYAHSLAYQQESYTIHQTIGDYNGMAWAGLDMAATFQKLGRMAEAEQYLTEHLKLARRIGARSAEGYGLIQSGSWELCQGNYMAAEETFRQALLIQQVLRTEHGRVAAEVGIGFAMLHLGDAAEARYWFEQAIERARPIQHRRRLTKALIGQGLAACAIGEPHMAHGYLTEAVAVARDGECRGNLAAGLAGLARVERHLGDITMALTHATEAAQIANEIGLGVCEMWGELEIGLVWLAQGDHESALEHTRRAVDLARRGDESWIGTEQVYRAHAQVLRALHCFKEEDEADKLFEAMINAKASRIPDLQRRRRYLEYASRDP